MHDDFTRDHVKEFSSREINFTRDHVKEFSSREINSIDFTGVLTPREMSVNHHYKSRRFTCFNFQHKHKLLVDPKRTVGISILTFMSVSILA